MQACLDPEASLRAPSMEKGILTGSGILYLLASALSEGGDAAFLANLDLESLLDTSSILDSEVLSNLNDVLDSWGF